MNDLPQLLLNEILFRLDRRDMARMWCTNRYFQQHMSEDPYFGKEYKSNLLFPISNKNLSSGDFILLGCCSGLLLLFVGKLFVVNPSTRMYRLVSHNRSRLLGNIFSDPEKRVGIGFTVDEIDPDTQRFRIVCLIEAKEEKEAKTMYQFEVSSGDSFWTLSKTTITCHSSELVKGTRHVYLDQVLYWLRQDGSIVAFNTVTEKANLLQTEFLNPKAFFCTAPGLTLLEATEEVICVYALMNTVKWVLVRRIPNKVVSEKKGMIDMIVASKEPEAEEEPEIVGRITRSRAREMAKEAHSLIAEGYLNLPMIQVFNIFTMKTSPGNDN